MFLVKLMKKSAVVLVMGREVDLPLVWADGQCGALPVFKTYEDAFNYCGDDTHITEIKEITNAISGKTYN